MKRTLTIPIYDCEVILHVAKNFAKAAIEAHCNEPVTGAKALTLHYPGNPGTYALIFKKDEISQGAIAHEASHLSHKILRDLGVKPDFDNDEAEAYLVGFIVDLINQAIEK